LVLVLLGQCYVIKTLGNIYGFDRQGGGFLEKCYLAGLRKLLRSILKHAACIDVCTPQLYRNYREIYSLDQIHVVENSVNTERFYPMDRDGCKRICGLQRFDKLVGYCGGFPSTRGARQLVDVSPWLVRKYPDCGILIVGEDSDLALLQRKAKEYETDGHIVFAGIVDYEHLHPYINCLDVGTALQVNEKRIELVGNSSQKIRQYLACGVPILCPAGTNAHIIAHGLGLEVMSNNLDQVFEAVCFWFDTPEEDKREVRTKAYRFACEHLSSNVTYEKRYSYWRKAMMLRAANK
jgi:glycosyltransferase involved in cell wall biosynthesis